MMPWSGLSLTPVKYAYEMGTSELHRTSIMLAAAALTTNRSMYPKDLSRKPPQKPGRVPKIIKLTAMADQLFCAKPLDWDAPVTEVLTLVITGPDTPFVATRRTEQVLLDLITQAENELFLVSFVAGDWQRIIEELKKAHQRGITIQVLLEASKADGGTLDHDQSKELLRAIPNAKIYRWLEKSTEHQGGKVHAKIALADDKMAFISSANFTGHAMEKNLEAGLLVSGGHVPIDLKKHLKGLIELNVIFEVGS